MIFLNINNRLRKYIKNYTGEKEMWFIFALLSAVFVVLTSIFAKIGMEGINSNLATAIRTVVALFMAWEWYLLLELKIR